MPKLAQPVLPVQNLYVTITQAQQSDNLELPSPDFVKTEGIAFFLVQPGDHR
jgi:hypothetical protein